jgi:hypothetical protein
MNWKTRFKIVSINKRAPAWLEGGEVMIKPSQLGLEEKTPGETIQGHVVSIDLASQEFTLWIEPREGVEHSGNGRGYTLSW